MTAASRDGAVGAQRGLDLAELDAEAAHLHLVVGAAEELDAAVGEVPHEVAGAVEALAGGAGDGIGDEALGGQVGAVEVAARDAVAADVELARDAGGHGLHVLSRT